MTKKIDLSHIDNMEDLLAEQRRLKVLLRQQEIELKERVQQLPGEAVYAGLNAVVPTFLSGKITGGILGAARSLVNKFFSKESEPQSNSALFNALKQAGFFSLLKVAYRVFVKK